MMHERSESRRLAAAPSRSPDAIGTGVPRGDANCHPPSSASWVTMTIGAPARTRVVVMTPRRGSFSNVSSFIRCLSRDCSRDTAPAHFSGVPEVDDRLNAFERRPQLGAREPLRWTSRCAWIGSLLIKQPPLAYRLKMGSMAEGIFSFLAGAKMRLFFKQSSSEMTWLRSHVARSSIAVSGNLPSSQQLASIST